MADLPDDRPGRTSVFPSGPRATAWVLEDSPQQALAIEKSLRDHLHVRVFHDSPQLLEALAVQQPDVLILDWEVPEISGHEVLRIVRERLDEVTLPVVVLTADRSGATALEAIADGANDFITKPFVAAELQGRIVTLVRVRTLHARARLAEQRLQRVLDASKVGLWELDARTGVVQADARMHELMGQPGRDAMNFDSGLSLVHPEDAQRLGSAVAAALRGEQQGAYLIEFRTGGRDGVPLRWVESRAQASFDEAGVPTRLAGTLVDITARKNVELERERQRALDASRHSEAQRERAKLYSVFMKAPIAMAVLEGPDHVFAFANEAFRVLIGGRDVVGRVFAEALPDVARLGVSQLLARVLQTGEPATVRELPVELEHHETPLILNLTYTPRSNERGERDGVVMFGFDVTDLVVARQRLAQLSAQHQLSEAQLRLVTDTIPLLISFVTPDETYGLVNRAYEDWFGIPAEQVLGRKVRDVIGEAAYAVLGPYVKRGLAGERFSFEQYGVPYRHGGTRDVRVSFVPLTLREGAATGYVALLEDISEQRAIAGERERQSLFEKQLIGIVSHDLRTPLNVISLSSGRLARDEALDANAVRHVVRIQNATDRAVRMVADLLDFTQARLGGGIAIERRRGDIHVLIDQLLTELEAAFPERQIQYTHQGDGVGEWDHERIIQLAQNLITNAVKYSPADSVVNVATIGSEQAMMLRVHNTGDIIPAHKLPVLFEPMQRGIDSVDRATRSVGLGLYIVKMISEAHGGSVAVESREDAGTTFTVTLPRAGAQPA